MVSNVGFFSPSTENFGENDKWSPEANLEEGFQALAQQNLSIDFGNSLTRDFARSQKASGITSGNILQPDEAATKYPNIPEKFKEAVPEDRAVFLDNYYKKKQHLEKIKESAFGNGLTAKALDFTFGMGASLTDPTELAINVATGFGVQALGKQALKSASTSFAIRAAQKVATSPVLSEIAENTAGSVLMEPANAYLQTDLQNQYTINDAALNVIIGSTAFTGAKMAWKGLRGGYSKVNAKFKGMELDNNISRQAHDLPPTDIQTKQITEELYAANNKVIDIDEQTRNYKFDQFTPETKKVMYGAVDKSTDASIPFGHYLGDDLVYLTDNPKIANNLTNGKFSEGEATFNRTDITELNILDADEPLNSKRADGAPEVSSFNDPAIAEKFKDELLLSPTLGRLIDKVKEGIDSGKYTDEDLFQIMDSVKAQGYDGLKITADNAAEKHHGVYVFPEAKERVKYNSEFSPVKEMHNDFSAKYQEQAAKELDSPNLVDSETTATLERVKDMRIETPDETFAQVETHLETMLESVKKLEKDGKFDADTTKKVVKLREDVAMQQKLAKNFEAYIDCIGGSLV